MRLNALIRLMTNFKRDTGYICRWYSIYMFRISFFCLYQN